MHFHIHPDKDTAGRLYRIERLLGNIVANMENLMATFEDLKAAQDATDAKIDAVKADIQTLMDKLAAIPPGGLTPEQEAALADAVAHAQAINEKLGAIDAMNP
jgi:hypothetical protein